MVAKTGAVEDKDIIPAEAAAAMSFLTSFIICVTSLLPRVFANKAASDKKRPTTVLCRKPPIAVSLICITGYVSTIKYIGSYFLGPLWPLVFLMVRTLIWVTVLS